ncbi:MAG: OB-fold nucleic acid binding domain-containing protein [Candidatus Hermodarchaeota archaeon]
MSGTQTFRRFPAVRCWIKHIIEGKYSEEEKIIFTIFGKVKIVRLIGTIVQKREIVTPQSDNSEDLLDEELSSNVRIEFDLDDGTGLIRAILWDANPEDYDQYNSGDIVDVIGRVREWRGYFSMHIKIIKKIHDPNRILLRNAEILQRIKSGDVQEIPTIEEGDSELDEFPDEIDINESFEGDQSFEAAELKDKVYLLIKKNSTEGNGISIRDLKEKIDIPEDSLKTYLRDLEMEAKIYQSEENFYQTY